jgi:methionyl-tRNA formyltransferase
MKFFYLAHSRMSLICLEELVRKKYVPQFVAVHKDYEKDLLGDIFFSPMKYFCSVKNIKLFRVMSINDIPDKMANTDLGICVGFMEIIKPNIFSLPKHGIINLHCGKLPDYRGRAPISRTIMDNKKNLILTVHMIDKGVDSGDICNEIKIPVSINDDAVSLYDKCCKRSAEAIVKTIRQIKKGELIPLKQKADPELKAHKKLSREERLIKWNEDVKKIYNKIRALTPPYPGAIVYFKGEEFIISKAIKQRESRSEFSGAGKILYVDEDGVLVQCKNGIIKFTDIRNYNLMKADHQNIFKINDNFS